MFIVKKTEEKNACIYPDSEYLSDYKDSDFGSLISTIGIESIISNGNFQLGNSSVYISVTNTNIKGDAGIELLKQYAKDIAEIIENALPLMSSPYREFYEHFISDFKSNGLIMPMYGKII